jgi:hypothetical protein
MWPYSLSKAFFSSSFSSSSSPFPPLLLLLAVRRGEGGRRGRGEGRRWEKGV